MLAVTFKEIPFDACPVCKSYPATIRMHFNHTNKGTTEEVIFACECAYITTSSIPNSGPILKTPCKYAHEILLKMREEIIKKLE